MLKKLSFSRSLPILALLTFIICSFTYLNQKSNEQRLAEKSFRYDAYDGNSNIPTKKISDIKFWNAPMIFEGEKVVGDAIIGPEIPITGLTGFYDYHFNGNQPHYMYRSSSTVMHAAYMLSLDSLNVSPSRRVKYAFSSDEGTTWTDLGEVPSNLRAGFPSVNSKTTGEAEITSHYNDNNNNLQAWSNYDISPGIGVFTGVVAPEEFIWPIQARLTNGNMLVYGTTYRGSAATDTTTLAIFNNTTHTFGPRHNFFYPATDNSNSSLAIAAGTNGRATVIINSYRESGGNFGATRIFQFQTSDNGATWNGPVTRYNTTIIGPDTAAPYVNGATDVIYDNAGNTYMAFNVMTGALLSTANSRLFIQKNTDTPILVCGGSTSTVNPIAGTMISTSSSQGFCACIDHPCLSISDDQQYIFVSFACLFEDDTLNTYNKSHVFYTWASLSDLQFHTPVQVSDSGPTSNDERYCSIATVTPKQNGYYTIFMTYQKDTQPGSHTFDGAPLSRSWLVFRKITDATLIGVNNNQQTAKEYRLFQNYPNPFNPSTRIDYNLTRNSFVVLKLYDVLGQEVKTLVNGTESAGSHNIQLNASDLPSGVYFYSIKATDQSTGNSFTDTKKMILLK